MKDLMIVGAEQWCPACNPAKRAIIPIAEKLGFKIGTVDLGSRENFKSNKEAFLSEGYDDFRGVPSFFLNKKLIDRPDNLSPAGISKWLKELKNGI